jgi:uncharacterized membrane protein
MMFTGFKKLITHYSLLITLFSFVYVLLVPPFQSPDEPNHFFRAWQVSEGHFFPEKAGTRLGGTLPVSLTAVCDSFHFLKNNRSARLNYSRWRNAFIIPLESDNRRFTDFANTAVYAPTAYFPQAAAIAILRPLGATPLQLLYASRLANLFVWMALVTAALRLMPFMRSTLAAMAMLPASLCIAASANADVLTNGLCWWLLAAFLSASKNTAFWKKLLVVAVVVANKIITIPLLLLVFFVPPGAGISPSGPATKQRLAILLGIGLLTAIFWGKLAQGWFIPYDVYDPAFRDTQTLNSGVDPARQMVFVLEHPVFFIKTCFKSLAQALPSLAAHFVGKFGWEKNYLPAGWLVLLWTMLATLFFSEKNPLTRWQRWGMGAVTALYFGAFAITMYALWSAVGADNLDNWQGRYFVPIAPVVMLALASGWLEKWKQQIDVAAMTVLILSNVAMAVCVWERYYQLLI